MDTTVTIIGSAYFEPISLLLGKLNDIRAGHNDSAAAGPRDNGYSASLCILATACLESYVMRVRYINNVRGKRLNKTSVPLLLKDLYVDYPYGTETTELFVLRDLLFHNHLWEVSRITGADATVNTVSIDKRSSGDQKYNNSVDCETRTNMLGFNTNPVQVGYSDACLALKVMWKILLYLEHKDNNQCYVSHLHVTYKGEYIPMASVVGMPETGT